MGNCREVGAVRLEWQAAKEAVYVRLTAPLRRNQYMAFGLAHGADHG